MPDLFQPKAGELRDTLLRDLRLAAIDTGVAEPPTQPGSDWHILATAIDSIELLNFTNVANAESAASVLTSVESDLDDIREAEGLPVVEPRGSSGKIRITVLGPTTIADGAEGTLPNGLRWRAVGAVINPADQSEIDVEAIDVGEDTNLAAGETVRFVSPAPTNIAEEATVSSAYPLRGGSSGEDDSRKRDRILNVRRNRPAGGNWGQLRQWALDALPSVQDCYVYPAPGGPGSCKVVPVRRLDVDSTDYSRALSSAEEQAVRSYIQTKMGIPQEIIVQTCADEDADVALFVTLPPSALTGGNGQGWTDPSPWPPPRAGDLPVTITSASSLAQVTINADTTEPPTDGQTHIAWWSSADRKFQTRLVVAHSGTSGAWVLTLESPLLTEAGDAPAVGDYVCPSALNLQSYGEKWVEALGEFGPGELVSDPTLVLRGRRRPSVTDEDAATISNATVGSWKASFPEVTGFEIAAGSTLAPTVPDSVDDRPNVLVPRHFAIYEL